MKTFAIILSTIAMLLVGVLTVVLFLEPSTLKPLNQVNTIINEPIISNETTINNEPIITNESEEPSITNEPEEPSITNELNTLTHIEYISKIKLLKESLVSNSNGFHQVEFEYLNRELNQEQAMQQFNMYFSAYKSSVNELISLKIPTDDPTYIVNQELLTITENYYNHMVTKIDWTESGIKRSTTASNQMDEDLYRFNSYLEELEDLNENR